MTSSSLRSPIIVGISAGAGALAASCLIWKYYNRERSRAAGANSELSKQAYSHAQNILDDNAQQQEIPLPTSVIQAETNFMDVEGLDIEVELQQCDNFLLLLERFEEGPETEQYVALKQIVQEYQEKLQQPGWCTTREEAILAVSDILTEVMMSEEAEDLKALPKLDTLALMLQDVMSSKPEGGSCGGAGCGGAGCGQTGGCSNSDSHMLVACDPEDRDKIIEYLVDQEVRRLLAENVYLQYVPELRKAEIKERVAAEVDRQMDRAGQKTILTENPTASCAPGGCGSCNNRGSCRSQTTADEQMDRAVQKTILTENPTASCAPEGCGSCKNRDSCPSQAQAEETTSATKVQQNGAVKINLD